MPNYISKDQFRKNFCLRVRDVILDSGEVFQITSLNMLQKREIREANMTIKIGARGEETKTTLDVEGMIVDTIIASCRAPKFDELDKDWMLETISSEYIQDLYAKIETPVKLATMTEEEVKN